MESSVSFKSLFKDVHAEPEVRRFTVDRDVSTSLTYLREKLASIYPILRRMKDFRLTWNDNDGDTVTVGNDEEMIIALTEMKGPVYKFTVEAVNEKEDEPSIGNLEGEEHVGVTCDGCETSVVGFRYKCLTCPDYDLCGRCEMRGLHPGHNMIRIGSPQIAWPHHFYRRLHRMHDKMQKRSSNYGASPGKTEQEKQSWETAPTLFGNPYSQEQPRRAKQAQLNRAFCRGTAPMGPLRQKWLDAMMKGWAGNGDEDLSHQAAHEAEHEAAHVAAMAAHQAAHEAYHNGAPCPDGDEAESDEKTHPEAEYVRGGFNLPSPTEYLKNLGQMVANALDPLGVDVKIDVETPDGEMINIGGHEKSTRDAAGATAATVETDGQNEESSEVKKTEASTATDRLAEKAGEEDLVVFYSNDAIADALKEASSPSKVEDDDNESNCSSLSFVKKDDADEDEWTVVNKMPEVTSLALDDEIQSSVEPGQVLYGSVHGTLYPELPPEQKASTVISTIVPIAIGDPDGAIGSPATDEKEPDEKTPEPEIAIHPNPRIQTALQAMLNMGFTNDGGWLTQLLEMKNGDIGRVLDVLQPVQPPTRR